MKTRNEVQVEVDKLNEQFQEKKIGFTLYEETLVNRMDIGLNMLIVKTRVKVQKDGLPEMPKALREMLDGMQGAVEEMAKVSGKSMLKLPEKKKDEALERFVEEVEGIDGVRKVILFKYDFHVEKREMFDWSEVVPPVVKALELLGQEREFEKNGVKGIEV